MQERAVKVQDIPGANMNVTQRRGFQTSEEVTDRNPVSWLG